MAEVKIREKQRLSVEQICVCDIQSPFVTGGAELLVESLTRELQQREYNVTVVKLPFKWAPKKQVLRDCLAWRLLDIKDQADRVIATRFPSYLIPHPRKSVWLVHQFRPVYDLLGTPYSSYGSGTRDYEWITRIRQIDNQAWSELKYTFTIADNVAQRLVRYNGVEGHVLYPPPKHDGQYYNAGYGDYLFTASRLNQLKRLDLLIRALQYTRTPVRCLVAGTGDYGEQLRVLAHELEVTDKIEFLGYVSDERLIDLYAGCFAVFFAPLDEDYGFVTVEAFKSRKPVLTAQDSGAVLEFVKNEHNGYVVNKNDLQGLASKIDYLFEHREVCEALGTKGHERVKDINWERTIAKLMAHI
jgi:glycosyltransferase involved in cell wall biosynthesis